MATAAQVLARYAAILRYETLPAEVRRRALDCIIDTVGVIIAGSRLPWSAMAARYALRTSASGVSTVLCAQAGRIQPPLAALANGVAAHAFEMDSLRYPGGAGVHPGAALLPAALAVGEDRGSSGKAVIEAFVAACEVMFRIGDASRHTPEKIGFHAPGLTGTYGAAVAAGRLLGLDETRLTHALGIAGSLSSGLLAFSKSQGGGMIKRLHLGRAAEGGVLAASLAAEGYEAPESVLEGRFGFLEAFCRDADPSRLTAGLGSRYETLNICLKRFPIHVTAHAPVQALQELRTEHVFEAARIRSIRIFAPEKVLSQHAIYEPKDLMQAQYSLPFCVALSLVRDPLDPRSFDDSALGDEEIRGLCRRIMLEPGSGEYASGWFSRLRIELDDARVFEREARSFRGMPDDPPSMAELEEKFLRAARPRLDDAAATRLFERLGALERCADVTLLDLPR
ncbi:MAG: MmgE/PrpD family protein [Burkholderiales bacterium]|nr:MmgE/PrpD family protein [Burkholderiales bacterium]